jgi:hypothetical protein
LQGNGQVARVVTALSVEEENRPLPREVEVLRQERNFAKKRRRSPRKTCAAVRDDRPVSAEFPMRLMCRVLAVSPAGFHAWQRPPIGELSGE